MSSQAPIYRVGVGVLAGVGVTLGVGIGVLAGVGVTMGVGVGVLAGVTAGVRAGVGVGAASSSLQATRPPTSKDNPTAATANNLTPRFMTPHLLLL